MQYTLARPTWHSLNTIGVVIWKLDCLQLGGRVGWQKYACNANDKPPSSVHHPPAGSVTQFTRGRIRKLKNTHNSLTVQNWTHVYMNFFDHKDLGNHLLQ